MNAGREYSHAMGNSNGTLADTWAAIESTPGLQGGFIWEFWDHGMLQRVNDGRPAGRAGAGLYDNGVAAPVRSAGAPVGHHSLAVDELFTPYLRPQESGGRHGVRRFTLSAPDATGLAVELGAPSQVSVNRYRAADLAAVSHHDELVPRPGCVVHIDAAHRGLGTASCGPDTSAQYLVAPGTHRWAWTLRVL